MQLLLFWTGLVESLIFSPSNRSILAYKSYHFSELERCFWLHLLPQQALNFLFCVKFLFLHFVSGSRLENLRILVTVCKVNITVTFSLPSKHPPWSGQVHGAESKLVLLREIAFSNYCIFYLFCFCFVLLSWLGTAVSFDGYKRRLFMFFYLFRPEGVYKWCSKRWLWPWMLIVCEIRIISCKKCFYFCIWRGEGITKGKKTESGVKLSKLIYRQMLIWKECTVLL